MELAAFIIVLLFFSVYAWSSSVAVGMGLLRLFPHLSPLSARRIVPYWEIGLIFLFGGAAGLVLLFHAAWVSVPNDVLAVLVVALVALVIRSVQLLLLSFRNQGTGHTAFNYIFAVASMVLPLSLGAGGISALTGHPFWQTGTGWTFFATLIVWTLALSVSFIDFLSGARATIRMRMSSRVLTLLYGAIVGVVLVQVLWATDSHLLTLPFSYFAILAAGGVLWQSVAVIARREWRMWWYLSFVAFSGPLLLGLANYPYLTFSDFTLVQAYSSSPAGLLPIIALAVSFVVALGIGLFGWTRMAAYIQHENNKAKQ